MNLEFTIIIPTFNRPQNLSQCLSALARSDFARERFEVIIVDDGGATTLDAVVASFHQSLNVTSCKQTNAGPAAARNYGAQFARGKYLAFTDDDCLPAANWLSSLESRLSETPGCMVGGRVANALTENVYSSASQLITDLVYAYYNADSSHARFAATNNMAVPADLFRALGGFNPTFRTSEDRDWCDRWLTAGYPFLYAEQAVIHHAHHLTLYSFWQQHVAYGRGARRFNRAHARRGAGSTIRGDFYVASLHRLTDWLPRMPIRHASIMVGLLTLWQIANTFGFTVQAIQSPVQNALDRR